MTLPERRTGNRSDSTFEADSRGKAGSQARPGFESGGLRGYLPGAVLGAVALVIELGGNAARAVMRYERSAIESGEAWRLVTGHLAHLGWSHLALNLAGLALVVALVGQAFPARAWLAIAAVSIVAMDAGLWIGHPELAWYVGLSGLLHGLLAAGALKLAADGEKDMLVLSGLVAVKLGFEQWQGALPLTAEMSGGPVIVDAHLYGAIGGAVAAVVLLLHRRGSSSRTGL